MASRILHAVPFFAVLGFWIALGENYSNFIDMILQSKQLKHSIKDKLMNLFTEI